MRFEALLKGAEECIASKFFQLHFVIAQVNPQCYAAIYLYQAFKETSIQEAPVGLDFGQDIFSTSLNKKTRQEFIMLLFVFGGRVKKSGFEVINSNFLLPDYI